MLKTVPDIHTHRLNSTITVYIDTQETHRQSYIMTVYTDT